MKVNRPEFEKDGIFEWLVIDDRPGFVHIWSHTDRRTLRTGERIKSEKVIVDGSESFSVAVQQGGYVNVRNGRLVDFSDQPGYKLIVDRFGRPLSVAIK
jgi:hypothetical protein